MARVYQVWQRAEVARRLDMLSGFVAMCVAGDEHGRRRLARLVGDAEAALAGPDPDLEFARDCLEELVWWVDKQWGDHPHRPVEARPDEADRQTRDYAKDLLRGELPVTVLDERSGIELSLEVRFLALCREPMDCSTRQDLYYVAGRAAMALDLGLPDVARLEMQRMEQVGAAPSPNRSS